MGVNLKSARDPLHPNLGAAFRFEDPTTGLEALVSLATVLQCLCVSRDKHLVPEFTSEWKATALPEIIERMAADPSEGQGA